MCFDSFEPSVGELQCRNQPRVVNADLILWDADINEICTRSYVKTRGLYRSVPIARAFPAKRQHVPCSMPGILAYGTLREGTSETQVRY